MSEQIGEAFTRSKPLTIELRLLWHTQHSVSRLNVQFLNSVDDIAISEEEITLRAPLKI